MARILVLYGTTNGHTARVAGSIAGTLRALGHSVEVIDPKAAWPSSKGKAGRVGVNEHDIAASFSCLSREPNLFWIDVDADD